ncbi:MAG TPA: hypothetical protein VGE37_04910 [Archangium sp.]
MWTLVEEAGAELIIPGLKTVNRSGFLITTVPWSDADEVVKL